MHLVVAWEHGDEVARLQSEIAARGLDWQVSWLPLDDEATASAGDLQPDALICTADSGWSRCRLILDEVRVRQPHAVRIVLREAGDTARAVDALEHAHRVLPEPLDARTVVEAVQGVLDLQHLLDDPQLKRTIERVGALPSAPRQYLALTRLLREPDATTHAITAIVAQDPALAARVLRLSNSAYYAIGREIGDLRTAVVRLGLDALRRLVLASEVFASGPGMDEMRARALRTSWLAGQILPGSGAGVAATAGLLADVGRLLPQDGHLGDVPHSIAGAYLLGLWGLPTPIVEAVAYHEHPTRMSGAFWITGAVHVASALVNGTEVDHDYLQRVGALHLMPQWRALAAASPADGGALD
ncbi:MAG: HDOD domain-containing protein [Luteimonas sp.]